MFWVTFSSGYASWLPRPFSLRQQLKLKERISILCAASEAVAQTSGVRSGVMSGFFQSLTAILNQTSVPYRIVLAQLFVGLLASLIAVLVGGLNAGFAAGLGALIVFIPNGWLAWRVTGAGVPSSSDAAGESAVRILALSLMKFLTTAGAAALALMWFKPLMAPFMGALVATVLTAALVPPFLAPQRLARAPKLD